VIFRISSNAFRGFLVTIALVLIAGIAYSNLRRILAEHYAAVGSRQGLERATQLEPSNAYIGICLALTEALTSRQRLRLRLETPEIPHAPAAVTQDVGGTQPWEQIKMPRKSEKGVYLVFIFVCRYKSWDFDKKVGGFAGWTMLRSHL
jgi:hypothetical protein